MQTTAVPTEDGAAYLINGEKLWTTNGPIADLLIVMARTNDPEEERPEITAFIVEGDAEGLTPSTAATSWASRGSRTACCASPTCGCRGKTSSTEKGGGLSLALRTLNTGRLTLPGACGGAMKQSLAMASQWANERRAVGSAGRPPRGGGRQDRHACAAEIYAVESSDLADLGHWPTAHELDIRLEAAMAKLFCTEAMWRTRRRRRAGARRPRLRDRRLPARPRRGGRCRWSGLMRDARINLIIEGTSEIMRLFIAREALDPHLKIAGASATSDKMDLLGAAKFYATLVPETLAGPIRPLPGGVTLSAAASRGHLRFVERGAAAAGPGSLSHDAAPPPGAAAQADGARPPGRHRRRTLRHERGPLPGELPRRPGRCREAGRSLLPPGAAPASRALHRAVYRNDDRPRLQDRPGRPRRRVPAGWQRTFVSTWRRKIPSQ